MSVTFTREGAIPHLQVVTTQGVILAPVKLATEPDRQGRQRIALPTSGSDDARLPAPMRRGKLLVFALPGGGEVEA